MFISGEEEFLAFSMVNDDNKKDVLKELCTYLFSDEYIDFFEQDADNQILDSIEATFSHSIIGRFVKLLNKISCPFTLVVEPYYIDQSYRDTFYMYYSNQHFSVNRSSVRLSL